MFYYASDQRSAAGDIFHACSRAVRSCVRVSQTFVNAIYWKVFHGFPPNLQRWCISDSDCHGRQSIRDRGHVPLHWGGDINCIVPPKLSEDTSPCPAYTPSLPFPPRDRNERFGFEYQKVKVQGHGGINYSGNSTLLIFKGSTRPLASSSLCCLLV